MKKLIVIFFLIITSTFGYIFYSNNAKENSISSNTPPIVKQETKLKKWMHFDPKEENFSALFPLKPSKTKKTLPIPGSDNNLEYYEYQCTSDNEKSFSISYINLPHSFLKWGNSIILSSALKLVMKDLGQVTLNQKSSNVFKTFPSIDYKHHSSEKQTAGTLILIDSTLYKVEVSYNPIHEDNIHNELIYFLESFQPVKKEELEQPPLEVVETDVISPSQNQN